MYHTHILSLSLVNDVRAKDVFKNCKLNKEEDCF